MKKILFVMLLSLSLCVGCSSSSGDSSLISYIDAKEKIINESAILLDVRTEDEYNQEHISGALLLTLDEISSDTASAIIGDKNQEIIVYCASGVRSNQALSKLKELGYKNVYDLGAMSNWEE